uniref:acetate--CoA ligase n=1 Tax=Sinocyclocheilus grahami TaxID=75366 RepID=A0A672ML01_SINGR
FVLLCPEFWGDVAEDFFWKTKYTGKFLDYNFDVTKETFLIFTNLGKLNLLNIFVETVNNYCCLMRVIFLGVVLDREGNEPGDEKTVTYRELLQQVCKFANVLKSQGVKKGDRVSIYMPMVVELVVAMLACARIGAVHAIVVPWNPEVDLCWHSLIGGASEECEPVWCDSEDPLFILYTSGSTGKPKGVLHTVSGYMLYTAATFKLVFDYHSDDVYWCTADIGWITGHSYITYGPLANGATSVLFEGLPTYPDVSRMWEIVDKYHVSKFYTAPTAIRLLMKYGSEPVQKYNRTSLKILGTVGEPINPEAWQWYYSVVGEKRCPVVDTFWQTETGGHVMTPLPAATPMKPGSATFPFFGVVPAILNESGEELEGPSEGYLVFKQPWPGVMRTVYGNHERFETTYFKKFPGFYVTGDGCRRDKDGYYWITGRIDDMLNVSGHLLSTAEVESALVEHEAVAEAAVVGRPHPVKGESLYCFVTLNDGINYNQKLEVELKKQVREKIGAIATPDYIQNAPGLPKTRSGKIMRRVLRKIACNEQDLGDVSTLADSSVIEQLFENRYFYDCKKKQMLIT